MKKISVNNESIRVFLSMKEIFECSVKIRKIDRQRADDHLQKYGAKPKSSSFKDANNFVRTKSGTFVSNK